MPFIYHYHAAVHSAPGETTHIDGLLACQNQIDTMDRYHEIKKIIAGDAYVMTETVITSLSLLHEVPALDLSPISVEV